MVGPLPDISMIERLIPIEEMIERPVSDDPVKPMASTPGCCTRVLPMSPAPGTTDTRPLGTPASSKALASSSSAQQVNSGGLAITALPVASPGPRYSSGIVTGKFHGVIATHTPTGRWKVNIRLLRSVVGIVSPESRLTSSAALRKYWLASAMSSSDSAWYGLPCSKRLDAGDLGHHRLDGGGDAVEQVGALEWRPEAEVVLGGPGGGDGVVDVGAARRAVRRRCAHPSPGSISG